MNYDYPINTKIVNMIEKLEKEGQLTATYLYKNESQQRTLRYLIENEFVTETKIPHTHFRLINITDKGRKLGDLLSQVAELFPPVETTTNTRSEENIEDGENINALSDEHSISDDSNEVMQMTLEANEDD